MRFRVLCLLMAVVMVLPMGSSAEGFVSPVQALSSGIVKLASVALSSVSDALSELGGALSDKMGSLGNGFKDGIDSFLTLLSLDPPDGDGDEDPPADPHNLAQVYWNPSPEDTLAPDGTIILLKGDDENSGEDDTHPVLTWERALSLVSPGGTIWVMTMETVLYSDDLPVTVRDGGLVDGEDATQVTELKFYPGNSFLMASAIEETISPIGASLTLKNLKMTDKTVDEDPEDQNRLINLNGGTVTLDSGMEMRGDVRIEMFSDETDETSSPEIFITEEFMNDFDANVDFTVHFDTDSQHHTNSGDRVAFDFLVFPDGFDVEPDDGSYSILDNVHLDPLLQEPRGEDNLIWNVRKKIGSDNIVEIFLVEPYDGCVYVSGEGNDAWEGLYYYRPVRTFERALEILMGNGGDLSYAAFISDNVTTINEYRQMHGEFVPNEGLIRICGAPVQVTDTRTWSMPQETYWDRGPTGRKLDSNGNPYPRVDHSWVERYRHYVGDMIEVSDGGELTFADITVKGMKSEAKPTGSILLVETDSKAILSADSLLTDNQAVEGGGARLVGPNAELVMEGGKITNNLATRNGNTGRGGGVYAHGGILTMNSGEITDNSADQGGGIYADRYEQMAEDPIVIFSIGRICLYGESVVTRNKAREGAGVFVKNSDTVILPNDATDEKIAEYDYGTDTFSGVCCISVTGNTASVLGGGWFAEDCTLTVDGAEITGNKVLMNGITHAAGGGIALRRAFLKMVNESSVHDNFVRCDSAPGNASYTLQGGGIYSTSAPAALKDGDTITKYSIDIESGCSLYNNYIDSRKTSGSNQNSANGGALCIGGASGAAVRIDGEVYCNYTYNSRYPYTNARGAGLYLVSVNSWLGEHCRVHDNIVKDQGYAYGMGVFSNGGALHLDNCEIDHNIRTIPSPNTYYYGYAYYTYGGGVYKTGGTVDFNACTIHDNIIQDSPYVQTQRGGGAFLENLSTVTIEPGMKIYNHTGYTQGGGIYINCTSSDNPVTVFTSTETNDLSEYAEIYGNRCTTGDYYGCGGGIYVYGSQRIDLKCLKIYDNIAGYAGGMYVQYNKLADLDRCIFTGNRAEGSTYYDNSSDSELAVCGSGGAFYYFANQSKNTDLKFTACEFYNNYARDKGGAVYLWNENSGYYYSTTSSSFYYFRPVFDSCIFGDGTAANANRCNTDSGRGGAIFLRGGDMTVTGASVFDGNSAWYGGAIFALHRYYPDRGVATRITAADSAVVFRNNYASKRGGAITNSRGPLIISGGGNRVIFENNSAGEWGGAIYSYQGDVRLDHCDFINDGMQWVEPEAGESEGHWEPTACKGRSLASYQAYIYLDASSVTADEFYLHNFGRTTSHPRSNIRLTGAPNAAFGVLKVDLNITANTYYRDGDIVVEATSSVTDCTPYLDNFELVGAAAAVYNLTPVGKNLVLAPKIVYIDGIDGDDSNPGDLPTRAVKTFPVARQKLVELLEMNPEAPLKICIVNTVTINAESTVDESTWTFDGYKMPHLDEETGERDGTYVQIPQVLMQAYIADNRLNQKGKALIDVKGGDFTFDGITLDGNRSAKPANGANYGIKIYNDGTTLGKAKIKDGAVIQNHRSGVYGYGGNADTKITVEIGDSTFKNCDLNANNSYSGNTTGDRDYTSAGLTLNHADLTMNVVTFTDCLSYCVGGGIVLRNSTADVTTLTVKRCRAAYPDNRSNYGSYINNTYYNYNAYLNGLTRRKSTGGGALFINSDAVMADSLFEECSTAQTSYVYGGALGVWGGALEATNVVFNKTGDQAAKNSSGALVNNGYCYGALHVGNGADVTLNLCTFTNCYGYYGGAIVLDIGEYTQQNISGSTVYRGYYAPTLHINGCTFGGSNDNSNYAYFGGSVIFSQGLGNTYYTCKPQVYIDGFEQEVDGETVVTPTTITYNWARNYYGAIFGFYTDFHIKNAVINNNRNEYQTCNYYNSYYHWMGGSAIYVDSGSLSMDTCTVKSNVSWPQNSDSYTCGGAITVCGRDNNHRDASLAIKNTTISNNRVDSTANSNSKYQYGAGVTCRWTSSVLIEDSLLSSNVNSLHTSLNTAQVYTSLWGGGMFGTYCSAIVLRNNQFLNNRVQQNHSPRVGGAGSAAYFEFSSVILENVTASGNHYYNSSGNTVYNKPEFEFACPEYIGFKSNVSVEGDISLRRTNTPITLLSPLSGEGELKLLFDETYLGRHIVCGYTDDESEETYAENHVYTGLPSDFPNETGEGTLNAWDYLDENSSPRFVAAEKSAARNLYLGSGADYEEYNHDIIVENDVDVYLDGQTGVDPTVDADGEIISFNADASGIVHNGRSPKKAVKTFAAAKKVLESSTDGGNIIVCGRVDVTGEESWTLAGFSNKHGQSWQPKLLRYNNPTVSSYDARYTGYLINVQSGGNLTLDAIEIDGVSTENETVRIFNSLINVSGGQLILRGGTRLTNNNSEKGGAVSVTDASSVVEMLDATIDHCTVDVNDYTGAQYGYGGALYVTGGEFRMMSDDSLITACGCTYLRIGSSRNEYCYGAAVYVNGGRFRMLNGKITDSQLFRPASSVNNSSYSRNIYGAVCVDGNRYNEETKEGSLMEIGGEVSYNFLNVNDQDFRMPSTYDSNKDYPMYIYGSAIAMYNNGLGYIMGERTVSFESSPSGVREVASPGGNIVGNRTRGRVNYGIVYIKGNNRSDLNNTALLRMTGGVIDGWNHIDSTYSTYPYIIYICDAGGFEMSDGKILMDYCYQGIYDYGYQNTFTISGGEIFNNTYNMQYTIYVYDNVARIQGGRIHGRTDKRGTGIYASYGQINISGGEIYDFSTCVDCSDYAWGFNMSGGKIHSASSRGIYFYSYGNKSISGGEICNCPYGIEDNTYYNSSYDRGYVNISKVDIHDCTKAAIYKRNDATLNIKSDNVKVHDNICSQAPVYMTSGKLNITGCEIYDNRAPKGGIWIDTGATAATIAGSETEVEGQKTYTCRIHDNTATNRGGGIWISAGNSKTFNISKVDVYNNTSTGNAGGIALHYNQGSSTLYTTTFNLSDVYVHDNVAATGAGGIFLETYTTSKETMVVNMTNVTIEGNKAGDDDHTAAPAGGVDIRAGQESTTANPGRLTMDVNFYGCTIKRNTATGNGGGVYANRYKRNDVRLTVRFQNSSSGKRCNVTENTAMNNGGGIAIKTNTTNATTPVRSPSDLSVYLTDTRVTKNTAQLSGGGVWIDPCGMTYINNAAINENEAKTGRGGAIALVNEAVCRISQGEIKKNNAAGSGIGNGIYVDKGDLQFANNYAKIDKNNEIYLNDLNYPITMWRSFTRPGNIYYVYPSTPYLAGSIVVKPGGYCDDASPFLQNFYSVRPGTVIDRLTPYLIIGRIVFLDGETGLDPTFNDDGTITFATDPDGVVHDGSSPLTAFKHFRASKRVLGDVPGSIYVSGPVHYRENDPNEDTVWTLGDKQYIRRYCGFTISGISYDGFKGDMFSVEQGELTIENIGIEGSYRSAESFKPTGSVFAVNAAQKSIEDADPDDPPVYETAKLTIKDGAYIKDNITTGNGSGVRIERGTLDMLAGEISGNTTSGNGAAVYQGDTFTVQGNSLKIEGDVFLAKGNTTKKIPDHHITVLPVPGTDPDTDPGIPAMDFAPADNTKIEVSVENPFHGRDIAKYPEGNLPGDAQKAVWELEPDIAAMYILDNEPARKNMLELRLPYAVYIDGVDGHDWQDGLTPETAVRTPERAYELINHAHFALMEDTQINGGVVFVVNTVTVHTEMSLGSHYKSGSTDIDAFGTVMFKRYSQPTAHESLAGFDKPTHKGSLFNVTSGGVLSFDGVILDGHSLAAGDDSAPAEPGSEGVSGLTPELVSELLSEVSTEPASEPASESSSEPTSGIGSGSGSGTESGSDPRLVAPAVKAEAALVNVKANGKVYMTAGAMQNAVSTEEKGAAITVNENAFTHITGGIIKNCFDNRNVHIYDTGDLRLSGSPDLYGKADKTEWIWLEHPEGEDEVRITVPAAFTPVKGAVNVLPATAFNGRDICRYTEPLDVPDDTEKVKWNLPAEVTMIYVLNNNDEDAQILELQLKACVYVDGVNGSDLRNGKTPETAVKTLKQAYKLLSSLPGSTIYVVNNVTLTGSFILDGTVYDDGEDMYDAGGPVQIIRYSQPTAYNDADPGDLAGYGVESYTTGPLITVAQNVSLVISGGESGITIDGHALAVTEGDPRFVSNGLITSSALLRVDEGGTLTLSSGSKLLNNSNTLPGGGMGGAVENSGMLILDGAEINSNAAAFGSGIYQNGSMELDGTVSPVMDLNQQIYLTGLKDTDAEHIIEVTGMLDDDFKCTLNFEWPQGGRNAVHFAETYTFDEEVRNEIDHFVLAPEIEYIIVQSPETTEPDMLELCEIFTVRYHGNGGILADGLTEWLYDPGMPYNSELAVYTYFKGDIIPVRQNSFTGLGSFSNAGKTFVAWNTKADGSGKTFFPGDKYWSDTVGIFKSVTLYAVWEDTAAELSVTYKPNNGIDAFEVVDAPPYHQLDVVTVRFNSDDGGTGFTVPDGKRFYGWNTRPDESGEWYFPPGANIPGVIPTVTNEDGQFVIAGNIVLYAIYRTLSPYSLTIFKYADMRDLREPNKTFLFEIEDIWPLSDNYGAKYYVYLGTYTDAVTGETMPAWIDNSYCYTTVTGLPESKYLISEVTDWSWRYTLTDAYGADTVNYTVSAEKQVVAALNDHRTVSFKNELTNPYYVNGYARSWSNTFLP
ncbi:MAG: hypothetical protein K6G90_12615 [Clostridia bacterium]|nr:hypothetical protein [Clostridia bacterium]